MLKKKRKDMGGEGGTSCPVHSKSQALEPDAHWALGSGGKEPGWASLWKTRPPSARRHRVSFLTLAHRGHLRPRLQAHLSWCLRPGRRKVLSRDRLLMAIAHARY